MPVPAVNTLTPAGLSCLLLRASNGDDDDEEEEKEETAFQFTLCSSLLQTLSLSLSLSLSQKHPLLRPPNQCRCSGAVFAGLLCDSACMCVYTDVHVRACRPVGPLAMQMQEMQEGGED